VGIRGEQVLLRVRADERGGKRIVAVDGVAFICRFLQHVLPAGFKRIRHYGLLAPAAKVQRLALARRLLQMPMPNPHAVEDAAAFMRRVAAIGFERGPHCRTGRWRCVQSLSVDRAALAAIATSCRGAAVSPSVCLPAQGLIAQQHAMRPRLRLRPTSTPDRSKRPAGNAPPAPDLPLLPLPAPPCASVRATFGPGAIAHSSD